MMGSFGLLALALTAAPSQEVTDRDRFNLFNNCKPMRLVVEDLRDDAGDIGLTEERLRFAVESRLRAARLYALDDSSPYLYVNVNVVGGSFHVGLYYHKAFFDFVSGAAGVAVTWFESTTGTHAQDAEYIVSGMSALLDKFLTEYLQVNESACTGSPQPPTQ